MRKADSEELISRARDAARCSYSPYSHFPVGAALLCSDGTVITGANVENRSYGLACCAERSAIFAAVSQGERISPPLPCSARAPISRSPRAEHAARCWRSSVLPGMPVYFAGKDGKFVTSSVGELLPHDSLHELKKTQG